MAFPKRKAIIVFFFIMALYMQVWIFRNCASELLFSNTKAKFTINGIDSKIKYYRRTLTKLGEAARLNPLGSIYCFDLGYSFLRIFEDKELLEVADIFLYPRFSSQVKTSPNDILSAAERYLISAITLEPTNAFYHLRLGLNYIYMHRQDKAAQELEKARILNPTDTDLHYDLANYYANYFDKSKLTQSYEGYKTAILFADHARRLSILQEIFTRYFHDYAQLQDVIPDTDAARYAFAEFLRREKLYDESILELQRAIVLAEKNHNENILRDSYNWVGIIYFWKGEFYKAINYLSKALIFAKDKAYKSWIFSNLGHAYLRINEYQKAKDAYEMAITYEPMEGYNYYALGNLYEIMGSKSKALDYYRTAMRFNLNESLVSEINKKLEEVKIE